MRIGIDGRKIPGARQRGPIASLDHGKALGMAGVFFRTVLDISPTLDPGVLRAVRQRADDLGLYLEAGLGKVNPFATPEAPELRAIGDGDIVRGFRRMMEACAAIDCRELWVSTANRKPAFFGRLSYDRFRTDVTWPEQLAATGRFLCTLAPIARDLSIHMNLETHEEITSFEVVRLVETVGTDVAGIVYDTNNGLHRVEHPLFTARRVAPYVRQTHLKDAFLAFGPAGVQLQTRPCGQGVIDFAAIVSILGEANPGLTLTIENVEPHAERTIGRTRTWIEVFDQTFLDAHPDLTPTEMAAYVAMVHDYARKVDQHGWPDFDTFEARPFGTVEALGDIATSLAHLQTIVSAGRALP